MLGAKAQQGKLRLFYLINSLVGMTAMNIVDFSFFVFAAAQ
jgi:hypothetical protein